MNKEEAFEKVSDWKMINQKLKSELRETAQQLIAKSNELTNSKTELLISDDAESEQFAQKNIFFTQVTQ